jgi:hypothetical protein
MRINMSDIQEYTLRWRGREVGPFALSEINRQLDEHEIGLGHEIFFEAQWITLEQFLAALPKPGAPAPDVPLSPPPAMTMAPRGKSSPLQFKVSVSSPAEPTAKVDGQGRALPPRYRMVFAFLGVFLGFLGAHNFYARQWLTGLLQLLLSIATYLMGFGIIASWLWAMAEAVFVRKDGNDLEMI